jgi:hypothetical protein
MFMAVCCFKKLFLLEKMTKISYSYLDFVRYNREKSSYEWPEPTK